MRRLFAVMVVLCSTMSARGEVDSAAERWSENGRGGTPEFSRHVLPLIGKLGCNNRACHGSFQGQNGFRLSLFGSDPAADRKAFFEDRIDLKRPQDSLALLKPTRTVFHKGGERMKVGSWQYRLFLEWIKAGAPFEPARESRVTRLMIQPEEIVLGKKGDKASIRLVADFSDGTTEDVTALTTYESKDDSVAAVSEAGEISAERPGVAAIMATYGTNVISCQVLVARPDVVARNVNNDLPPNNHIDVLVNAQLKKLNIQPSELSSDEMFLRRVYLDVIGTLPTPDEVRTSLNDQRPDKRARLIDALLERPEYSRYWGTIFSDITGNQGINPHAQVSYMWQSWLEDKLAKNWEYDRIVGGIMTATTLEGRPREELVAEIEAVRKNINADKNEPFKANKYDEEGIYAKRNTLDLYWLRIPNRAPDRIALHTATAFLGIRFDCAECHRHPFDRWTKDDFGRFQSFFRVMDFRYAPTGEKLPMGQIHYGRDEAVVSLTKRYEQLVKRYPPRLPGGKDVPYKEGEDPRTALFEWMRAPDNPYFAPTLVNRLVKHYLGAGLVEPVEDFSIGNPPSNPALLNWLAKEFIAREFDLKWLHRQILNSRTYQLSWAPNDSNRFDLRNYSHAQFRRLPAEVLTDAIGDATGVPFQFRFAPKGARAVGYAPTLIMPYVLELFGRPVRKQTCGHCERSEAPALSQALYLLTDTEVNERVSVTRGRLRELQKVGEDRKVVEELYLCTLSRFPTLAEMDEAVRYRGECESRDVWLEDVLWSLLNVREFIFNH